MQAADSGGDGDWIKPGEIARAAEGDGDFSRNASVEGCGNGRGVNDRDERLLREAGGEQSFQDRVAVSGGAAGCSVSGVREDDETISFADLLDRNIERRQDRR